MTTVSNWVSRVPGRLSTYRSLIGVLALLPMQACSNEPYSQTLGGGGVISAGQTWNFQCWSRDALSPCGITNNVSNGLSVQFTP